MDLYSPVQHAADQIAKGDSDAEALLLALLAVDERSCNEHHALYVKEIAIRGLGKRLANPAAVAFWIPLLEQPGQQRLLSALFDNPLSPSSESSILRELAPADQCSLALALVAQPPSNTKWYGRPGNTLKGIGRPRYTTTYCPNSSMPAAAHMVNATWPCLNIVTSRYRLQRLSAQSCAIGRESRLHSRRQLLALAAAGNATLAQRGDERQCAGMRFEERQPLPRHSCSCAQAIDRGQRSRVNYVSNFANMPERSWGHR